MSDAVYFLLELEIKPSEKDNFEALMNDMVKSAHDEPEVLNYEWTLSEDGKICHTYEKYADSETLLTHLDSFGKNFAERFLAVFTPTRLTVYGNPNDKAREALSGFSPVYMKPVGGFAR